MPRPAWTRPSRRAPWRVSLLAVGRRVAGRSITERRVEAAGDGVAVAEGDREISRRYAHRLGAIDLHRAQRGDRRAERDGVVALRVELEELHEHGVICRGRGRS